MAKSFLPQPILARLAQAQARIGQSLAGEFLLFATSTLLYQGSRLAIGLVVAAWVGPEQFGLWNTANLVLLYGILVTLGVPNGMNREVPRLRGQGEEAYAQQVAVTSFWFTLATSIVGGLLILAVALLVVPASDQRAVLIWCAALFVVWQVYQQLQMWLKSMARFNQMSVQQVIGALLLPLVALPLAWRWGVAGFIGGQTVAFAIVCGYIWYIVAPRGVSWGWSRASLYELIQIGWPIMLAGLLYSLLTTIDRWVILQNLGVEALGHYSLAILSLGSLSLFPAVIAQQMYPRMAYRYGQTGDPKSLLPLLRQQTLAAAAVSVPTLAIVALILPYVVAHWLPAYVSGIVPAQILLAGLAMIALAGSAGNFLNTVGRQRLYLAVQALTILVSLSMSTLFVGLGLGLNGVAFGAACAYFFYASALWISTRTIAR